jgi:hypothetical protein
MNLLHCGMGESRLECPVTVVIGSPDADEGFKTSAVCAQIFALVEQPFEVEVLYATS